MRSTHLPLGLLYAQPVWPWNRDGARAPGFHRNLGDGPEPQRDGRASPRDVAPDTVTVIIAQSPDELIIETEANSSRESVTYSFARRLDSPRPVGTSRSNDDPGPGGPGRVEG